MELETRVVENATKKENLIFSIISFSLLFFLPWNENELKRRILRSNEYIKKTYVHILIFFQ